MFILFLQESCETCQRSYSSKHALRRHQRSLKDGPCSRSIQPTICSLCGREFKSLMGRRRHETRCPARGEIGSPKKADIYTCNYCDKQFSNVQLFIRHSASHNPLNYTTNNPIHLNSTTTTTNTIQGTTNIRKRPILDPL